VSSRYLKARLSQRIMPLAGVSFAMNRCGSPATAPAASLPLRTAPSIVEGHPIFSG